MVLPGVGAFDDCINALRKQELLEAARDFIKTGKPFLGICVGYQALFERSEEFNSCAAGLGIFKGSVVRFSEKHGLKIPQIGWNQLEIVKPDCPLYRGIASGSYVYFVHSFYPQPVDAGIVATRTEYGDTLCVVRLARQCFRHAISPGEKPESRPATAEEFCGTGTSVDHPPMKLIKNLIVHSLPWPCSASVWPDARLTTPLPAVEQRLRRGGPPHPRLPERSPR